MAKKLSKTFKLAPEVIEQIHVNARSLHIPYGDYIGLLVKGKGAAVTSPADQLQRSVQSLFNKEDGTALDALLRTIGHGLADKLDEISAQLDSQIGMPNLAELSQALVDWHHRVESLDKQLQEQFSNAAQLRLQLFKCKFLATQALSPTEQSIVKMTSNRLSYSDEQIAHWYQEVQWHEFFKDQQAAQKIAAALKRAGGHAT
jgi:hypothetical protein